MIRRIAAMAALVALVIAIGSQLGGHEGFAETCGAIAFFTLFVATVIPPLGNDERPAPR
jgi:hypothetical protein